MQRAQAFLLDDGKRLHLQHGPIDLIVQVFGHGRQEAYRRAAGRFETVLEELVSELPQLRQRAQHGTKFSGSVAGRMQHAVQPFCPQFITPMAAVAGSVADEILFHMCDGADLEKAYVNNGGDVAFHLAPGQRIDAVIAAVTGARITIGSDAPYRGVATSGWRGRSFSLGIADSVSVIANDAAIADAAATMIANAVDVTNSPAIERTPARELSSDSDLGKRLVTTGVGALFDENIRFALGGGIQAARSLLDRGLIGGASLQLQGSVEHVGAELISANASAPHQKREFQNA
ncbi:MAG: UPF0280 family protein [Hyphomicrobiales bacterium]|nr:UPF0280 family protein [Hyphomicrobiales bacterium]